MPETKDDFAASIGAVPADDDFAASIGAVPADFEAPKAEGPGVGESLFRGFAGGITGNHSDELTAAVGALRDSGMAALGMRGDIDFDDAYKTYIDKIRAKDKAAQEANPLAYGGANLAGSVATSAVLPSTTATTVGRLATAGVQGGVLGSGQSEADLMGGDVAGYLKDVGIGAGTGLAAQGAGELAVKAAAPLATRVADSVTMRVVGAGEKAKQAADSVRGFFGNSAAPKLKPDLSNWDEVAAGAVEGNLLDDVVGWGKDQLTPRNIVKAVATGGKTVAVDAATDVAKKTAFKYGPGLAAKGFDKIGDMLLATPEKFGRYAGALQAAAKRSPHALAVTHFLLQQRDEEYRRQIGDEE